MGQSLNVHFYDANVPTFEDQVLFLWFGGQLSTSFYGRLRSFLVHVTCQILAPPRREYTGSTTGWQPGRDARGAQLPAERA